MQRPTLLEGILVALVCSLLSGPVVLLGQALLGGLMAWKAALVVLTSSYTGYLLLQSGRKRGRTTLGLIAPAGLLVSLMFHMPLSTLLLLSLGLIWGIRSLLYSRSLLSAVLQGAVCLLGCGAAHLLYAHHGSVALVLWSFFLIQAAFVLIPARLTRRHTPGGAQSMAATQESFARAYQEAQQALSRLQIG